MSNLLNVLALADTTQCYFGDGDPINVPTAIPNVVSLIIKLIQVVVPILLIIWGMIDFAKAVVGGDEDKIKAGQKLFIKRLIAGVIVFLVVTIVTLLLSLVSKVTGENYDGSEGGQGCIEMFINGTGTTGGGAA